MILKKLLKKIEVKPKFTVKGISPGGDVRFIRILKTKKRKVFRTRGSAVQALKLVKKRLEKKGKKFKFEIIDIRKKPKRFTKSIFFPPKHKALARKISIKSPSAFRESIRKVAEGGITLREFRALNLAKTRAKVQLKRKTLSSKERREFGIIAKIKIPAITKKKKR